MTVLQVYLLAVPSLSLAILTSCSFASAMFSPAAFSGCLKKSRVGPDDLMMLSLRFAHLAPLSSEGC